MPMRAPRICGCGLKIASGEQCPCERQRKARRDARYDAKRPSARQRGYNSRWERTRASFLEQHDTCEYVINGRKCGEPAKVVDHRIPHKGDKALFWNAANWMPVCTRCHSSLKQAREREDRGVDRGSSGNEGTGVRASKKIRAELGNSDSKREFVF